MVKIQDGVICLTTGLKNNMKKISYLIIISLGLIFASCASKNQDAENEVKIQSTTSISHSFLNEKDIGKKFTIKGKLVQDNDSFRIIENQNSKNRVTFFLTFEEDSIEEKLIDKNNDFVTVSGILISSDSPWAKGLKVLKVE